MHPLEHTWEIAPKAVEEGVTYILFSELEIPYLYLIRIVDRSTCTIQEWVDSFKDYKRSQGFCLVTKEQWLSKKKFYNHSMPVNSPFDVDTLREGLWKEEDLDSFYHEKIEQETFFLDYEWDEMKGLMRQKDGKLNVEKAFKDDLKLLLNKFPSIIRSRAINIAKQSASINATEFSATTHENKNITEKLNKLLSKSGGEVL